MARIKSKHYQNERKCGGCNWSVSVLYSFKHNSFKDGLCGDCFAGMLVEEKADVVMNVVMNKQ